MRIEMRRMMGIEGLVLLESSSGSSTSRDSMGGDKAPLVFGYEVSSTYDSSQNGHQGLSFPLGAGMVVLAILFISAIFSFFYHWFRLKKLATSSSSSSSSYQSPLPSTSPAPPHISIPTKHLDLLPCPPIVFVAGEHIPRFVAVPCPLFDSSKPETVARDDCPDPPPKGLPL